MVIVYDTLTGKNKIMAERFSNDFKIVDIKEVDVLNEPCFLLTRSFRYGEIPKTTEQFLEKNKPIGVAVSGNKNWGKHLFGGAGERIQEYYNIPLILKYEVSGTKEDYLVIKEWINNLEPSPEALECT